MTKWEGTVKALLRLLSAATGAPFCTRWRRPSATPKLRVLANPLMNSINGPPINLAITPNQHLAVFANSLDWVKGLRSL